MVRPASCATNTTAMAPSTIVPRPIAMARDQAIPDTAPTARKKPIADTYARCSTMGSPIPMMKSTLDGSSIATQTTRPILTSAWILRRLHARPTSPTRPTAPATARRVIVVRLGTVWISVCPLGRMNIATYCQKASVSTNTYRQLGPTSFEYSSVASTARRPTPKSSTASPSGA